MFSSGVGCMCDQQIVGMDGNASRSNRPMILDLLTDVQIPAELKCFECTYRQELLDGI